MTTRSAKRPRRQAKQERARDTVETLLEAAARVLARDGYARATTNRISQAAGVSVGTLYEYFANKEELFDALIRREIEAVVDAVRGARIRPGAPIGESIRELVGLAMGALRHGPGLIRSLEQVPGAAFRRRLEDARGAVIAFVRSWLAAHGAQLRVADLDIAAFVVVSAAEGVGANASAELFDERLADEVTALITLYLTGDPPGSASGDPIHCRSGVR